MKKIHYYFTKHKRIILSLIGIVGYLFAICINPSILVATIDLIVRLYESFSWPLLILLIILIFKKEILLLVKNIKSLKSKHFEVELNLEINKVSNYVDFLLEQVNNNAIDYDNVYRRYEWIEEEIQKIDFYILTQPYFAIESLFNILERAFLTTGKDEFKLTNAGDDVTFAMVLEFYNAKHFFEPELYDAIKNFESIYNLIRQRKIKTKQITKEHAQTLKKLTLYAMEKLPPGPQSFITLNYLMVTNYTFTKEKLKGELSKIQDKNIVKQIEGLVSLIEIGEISIKDFFEEINKLKSQQIDYYHLENIYKILTNLFLTVMMHNKFPEKMEGFWE